MNDDTSGSHSRSRGPRGRPRMPRASALVALAALAGTTCLAAACGGGGSASTTGAGTFQGGTYRQALAYARCMRAHGVPGFPDPSPQGNFSDSQLRLIAQSVPQARGANLACRALLPNGGFQGSATQLEQEQQQTLRQALKSAVCMRAHGFPDYPDPQAGPGGYGVSFPVVGGIDQNSPQYAKAAKTCGAPPPRSGGGS